MLLAWKSSETISVIKRASCANWLKYDIVDSFLVKVNHAPATKSFAWYYWISEVVAFSPLGKYGRYIKVNISPIFPSGGKVNYEQ